MTNLKPRTGGALLGLAAIVLLAASLVAVVVYRSATGPGSGANDVRLGWQAAPLARPAPLPWRGL